MIAIIDYGAGNLFSVKNALDFIGVKSVITGDKKEIEMAQSLILPGVGAFPDAMKMLKHEQLDDVIKKQAKIKPILGICLGMQMLFEKSFEFSQTEGLGLIDGYIDLIKTSYKIPHIGWNELEVDKTSPLLDKESKNSYVYFVHSFMAYTAKENVLAFCDYGIKIPALVCKGNIYGAQFHPEKSGEVGLEMLKKFGGLTQ
ncbi:MAG: imidazole glycerol phosphate synthase subunit HisH [Oscillospiraceae bacterium]